MPLFIVKLLFGLKTFTQYLFKNPHLLIMFAAAVIILIQHFSISNKNTEITNLNTRISELETSNSFLQTNLDNANTKIIEQNGSIAERNQAIEELDSKFEKAQQEKLVLQTEIDELLKNSGAPSSNSEAMNWLREKAKEIKTWQNQ